MRARLPLRISAIVLLLFAVGHSAGFLSFRPESADALAVMDSMRRVPFDFSGNTVHWMDLFRGFGLAISVSGFMFPIIAWRLSNSTVDEAKLAQMMAWILCAIQVGGIALSLIYFGPIQAAFSAACAGLLAWGAIRLNPRESLRA